MKLLVTLTVVIAFAEAVKIPSNFKTCNRKRPDFDSCLLEAARYGVTQLNRPYKQFKLVNLDPLEIPKIETSLETNLVNVTSVLTNCKFYGFPQTQIEKFKIDFERKTIDLAAVWPELRSLCHFDMDGYILRSHIRGDGLGSALYRNFRWNFGLTYEEVRKRNKTYVKPISSYFDGKPEFLSMNLAEQINGDRDFLERGTRVINDNWSELYDDVKFVYLNEARKSWLELMKGWFSRLSLEEAFDN